MYASCLAVIFLGDDVRWVGELIMILGKGLCRLKAGIVARVGQFKDIKVNFSSDMNISGEV